MVTAQTPVASTDPDLVSPSYRQTTVTQRLGHGSVAIKTGSSSMRRATSATGYRTADVATILPILSARRYLAHQPNHLRAVKSGRFGLQDLKPVFQFCRRHKGTWIMMKKIRSAFTLVELLIVIAIMGILAAILFPVLNQAKIAGKRTSSISNLHQIGLAIQMYADMGDGRYAIPPASAIHEVLAQAPTNDPSDYWRKSSGETFGDPLVGSYAYVRLVGPMRPYEGWIEFTKLRSNPTIVASVFYSFNRIRPLRGDSYSLTECSGNLQGCYMPDRVLRLRLDGSAKSTAQRTTEPSGGHIMFTWPTLFLDDDATVPLITGIKGR